MTVFASGVILYRSESSGPRILLLRNRDNGHWGFAKGRREPGDAHEIVTARREVAEETGHRDLVLHPSFRVQVDYVVRGTEDDGRQKRVVYFLAEAPATEPALSPEHDVYAWCDAAEAERRLAYGQLRDVALRVFETLARDDGGST